MLTWPLIALGWTTNLFQRGAASMARIAEVLDARPLLERAARPAALPPRSGPGRVLEFRDVGLPLPRARRRGRPTARRRRPRPPRATAPPTARAGCSATCRSPCRPARPWAWSAPWGAGRVRCWSSSPACSTPRKGRCCSTASPCPRSTRTRCDVRSGSCRRRACSSARPSPTTSATACPATARGRHRARRPGAAAANRADARRGRAPRLERRPGGGEPTGHDLVTGRPTWRTSPDDAEFPAASTRCSRARARQPVGRGRSSAPAPSRRALARRTRRRPARTDAALSAGRHADRAAHPATGLSALALAGARPSSPRTRAKRRARRRVHRGARRRPRGRAGAARRARRRRGRYARWSRHSSRPT
jgi:hypothetical protein